MFITKLNEALFDDFDEDGRSGGLHGLGLGVGLVENWPPSATKVTGVLRNVLEELGGETMGISFAYRELSDREFEKVKNPVGTIPFPVPPQHNINNFPFLFRSVMIERWMLTVRSRSAGFLAVAV